MKEQSFVLKRGEGLHDKNLIKHTVLQVETPRASTVDSTGGVALKNGKPIMKTSFVSPMARARQLAKQRRQAAAAGSDTTGASKDWDESLPSSSSPSNNSESTVSSVTGTPSTASKPSVQRLIPSSGLVPKSGYIPKSGTVYGEETSDSGRLPKFGVWDNNNDDSSPCYTLLFETVAQEKRIGGPIRIHAQRPCSPTRSEDLYKYNPPSTKTARKTRQYHSLLCCFVGS